MLKRYLSFVLVFLPALFVVLPASGLERISLKGSPDSMTRQHEVATTNGYDFVKTAEDVQGLIERHEMVAIESNRFLTVLSSVSHPYARPEVRLFVERLAEQYKEANGEKLVITSLTRPTDDQPWNAHKLSVHPAGLAVDFRISAKAHSRQWLEGVLLNLERKGVLDVTREKNPPHYHVALFPDAYAAYVEGMIGPDALAAAMSRDSAEEGELQEVPATVDSTVNVLPVAMATPHEASSRQTPGASIVLLLLAGGTGFWIGKRRGGKSSKTS